MESANGSAGTKKPRPRDLTENDVESWYEAAAHSRPPRRAEQIRAELQARNYWRWRAMKRQYKYFERQMKKMGLNPEDLRWLL